MNRWSEQGKVFFFTFYQVGMNIPLANVIKVQVIKWQEEEGERHWIEERCLEHEESPFSVQRVPAR